jgi:hypothetical protein
LALSWEKTTFTYTVLNTTSALSASFIKQLIGTSKRNCSVIVGHLSSDINMTTVQLAVENIDRLTLYFFANSLQWMPANKTIKRPTIFILEETGSSGRKS